MDGLALLASFLHRYPYGGERVMVYGAPAVVLLIAWVITRIARRLLSRARVYAIAMMERHGDASS